MSVVTRDVIEQAEVNATLHTPGWRTIEKIGDALVKNAVRELTETVDDAVVLRLQHRAQAFDEFWTNLQGLAAAAGQSAKDEFTQEEAESHTVAGVL